MGEKRRRCESVPFSISLCLYFTNDETMARRKLSQTQIACIIILWVVLVVYIFMYAEISAMTIMSIIISGAIVFIPIYKNIAK